MTDKILILDFGSQVTQLIARRVRENGVYCEIHPYTASEEQIRAFAPRGIILSSLDPRALHRYATAGFGLSPSVQAHGSVDRSALPAPSAAVREGGLTDVQVAEKLVISPRTVHAHISSIYSKLGVTSRSAATRYAIEHHLA